MSEILLHSKLRELEEELKTERDIRYKYEKELTNLKIEIGDYDNQLQEANTNRDREIESSKRYRQEIADLKQKIEYSQKENEEALGLIKRKHQEQMNEINNHLDALSKAKMKAERESKGLVMQVEEFRKENENLAKTRLQALTTCKELENRQIESTQRIDDLIKQLNEANDAKNRFARDHAELVRRNSTLEYELQQLSLHSKRCAQELDDARLQLENEILIRTTFENKARSIQIDLDSARAQLEEETEAKNELNRQYTRLQDEFKAAKDKIEKECEIRIEGIEDSKRKLNNKYLELQDQYNELMNKYSNSEKNKLRLQAQVDNLITDLDSTRKRCEEAIRHEKSLEKEVEELKTKLSSANAELDAAYQAARNHAIELSRCKHLNEQLSEQLEQLQKEKRRLSEELESTNNQLMDSTSRLAESDRRVKTLEAERQQLVNDLDDARDSLQLEMNKSAGLAAAMEKLKADTDKKILDRDNEIDALRLQNRRQLEATQAQLEEAEARHKGDIQSLKKKHQADLDDMRFKLDTAKKAKIEAENQQKKLQQLNKDLLDRLTEEQSMHDATRDQLSSAEKRASSYRAELDETKALFDRIEKAKKTLELEYHDLEDKLNQVQSACNRALAERKKFETDAITASDELHEVKFELRNADEKIRNLNAALLKKDEDLRHEKEVVNELDASKKALEQQLRDTQTRIEEAEEFAKREAKRISTKLEARIVQLETELDLLKTREQELLKEVRRLEQRNKQLLDQVGEEQAKLISLTEAYDKTQEKMKRYKGQIDGAEEQVAQNISKCKRLQRELEDAEDRAESIARTFMRASSINRTDNYDSDYGDSDYYSSTTLVPASSSSTTGASSSAPNYLRSTYLYSKPTNIDDYTSSSTRPSTASTWRSSKYKNLEIEDDDILVTPRYGKYSTSS